MVCVLFSKCRTRFGLPTVLGVVLALLLIWSFKAGMAQDFAGYQSPLSIVVTHGLSHPAQVAVDKFGVLYIADAGNNRIVMETPSDGGYQQSVLSSSSLNGPLGVAVDGNGNVYIADSVNGRVLKETLKAGSYVESVVSASTPHRRPQSLAVDGKGNLFVADPEYAALFKETPYANGYTETIIPDQYNYSGSANEVAVDQEDNLYISTGGGANGPVTIELIPIDNSYVVNAVLNSAGSPSLAVDTAGNVFLGTYAGGVLEAAPHGPYRDLYTAYAIDATISVPSGMAADNNGNLFVADYTNNRIIKVRISNGDFGPVDVGSRSAAISMLFANSQFNPLMMGSPTVVTQGVTGLDFVDAGTGTCTTNGPSYTYRSGEMCTVDIVLNPTAVGPRTGAVHLMDGLGNGAYSGFVRGTGVGPLLSFNPAVQRNLSFPNLTHPSAITADSAGNLYIAEAVASGSKGNAVVKESWNGKSYTETTVATGLAYPVGLAVDGAGDVFIADRDASAIVLAAPSSGGYITNTIYEKIGKVEAVALDSMGNLYFASDTQGTVKGTFQGPGWGFDLSTIAADIFATGIAVDGRGNIYLCDDTGKQILVENLGAGSYSRHTVVSGLQRPRGITVDGAGNLYFGDASSGNLLKEVPSGAGYQQSTLAGSLSGPLAITIDGFGRAYVLGNSGNGVLQIDSSAAPALNFVATSVGHTSADSPQTVTLGNDGNSTLTFPIPTAGYNPAVADNFTLDSNATSACPSVGSKSSAPGTLPAGATCQLAISFSPTIPGTLTGFLNLTDNSLNSVPPSYASQSIVLSGTAVAAATFSIATSPAFLGVLQGASATANVTVTRQDGFTGSVSLSASGLPSGITATFETTPTSSSSVVTFTASPSASPGLANISIVGIGNSVTAITTIALTVGVPPGITLSASPSSVTLSKGGSGSSTVTVTPMGGLTGNVVLTAVILSSPTGAQDLPSLSFGSSSPVKITNTSVGTATLSIATKPTASAAANSSLHAGVTWFAAANLTIASVLIVRVPRRRRGWWRIMSLLAPLMVLAGTLTACGGGGGKSPSGGDAGTTPGNYNVSVTGTLGSITTTSTVKIIVQ